MGANNSTRRVSFESDENENISVVKGIRLSENVINRMREPAAPLKQQHVPTPMPPSMASSFAPSPLLRPVPPPFDPITSLPPPPPLVEPVAPPAPPPPAPSATETVAAPPPPPPPPQVPAEQPAEPLAAPPLPEFTTPCESVAPPPQPLVEPVLPPPVPEPVAEPELSPVPPPPAAPAVDKEALRKKITDELYKGLEQDRAKAEQELQAWLEAEKTRASAQAQSDATSLVHDEVSRILSAERAMAKESLQQAVIRERISTEDERLRAQLYAKQLEAREADLQKQDVFYREQVARLEERSAQFYKVTTENYHKAADQVNAKFKRYEMYPVCADLQGQILACYKENTGKTLNCSNIAARYLQCVNNNKQNKLRTGG
ncbi:coiled-coil-helix-coiled-coil-helix domain containing 3a isoform X1 [Scomber scombrus]|uniref:coiled-coil-helix-coiled-coil-helix domain containing 3a isoform X1 n=1 Tax=Scomber scombrus TaxID=13677 RepID=UPI002DDB27BB|nr:coiled-coil-helix-coiled-coil-helix domain containing 3a isoform X1 [Scomber scombrus]